MFITHRIIRFIAVATLSLAAPKIGLAGGAATLPIFTGPGVVTPFNSAPIVKESAQQPALPASAILLYGQPAATPTPEPTSPPDCYFPDCEEVVEAGGGSTPGDKIDSAPQGTYDTDVFPAEPEGTTPPGPTPSPSEETPAAEPTTGGEAATVATAEQAVNIPVVHCDPGFGWSSTAGACVAIQTSVSPDDDADGSPSDSDASSIDGGGCSLVTTGASSDTVFGLVACMALLAGLAITRHFREGGK